MNKMRNSLMMTLLISQIVLFFYGCQESLEDNFINKDEKLMTLCQLGNEDFIDIELAALGNGDYYLLERYNQAKQRLDSVARFQDGQYYFTIESGREVGISEELFAHFKKILSQNNRRIQNKYLVEIEGKRLEFDKPLLIQLNGIQSRNVESGGGGTGTSLGTGSVTFEKESFWWGYIESAALTNDQAVEFFSSMKDAYGQGGLIVGLIPSFWAPSIVSWATAAVITLNGVMYEDYYNEAIGSGAAYELIDVYQPDGTTGSPHSYIIRQIK